jgi:hypothetical protein
MNGISLYEGSRHSTVRRCVAYGNGQLDALDANPSGNHNVWRHNKFGTTSPTDLRGSRDKGRVKRG